MKKLIAAALVLALLMLPGCGGKSLSYTGGDSAGRAGRHQKTDGCAGKCGLQYLPHEREGAQRAEH